MTADPTDVFTTLMAQRAAATDLHLRFLRDQHRLHEQFLRLRTRPGQLPVRPGSPAPAGEPDASAADRGPTLDRRDLERLAAGQVVTVFGPGCSDHENTGRPVRLPLPPLLLPDRVGGLVADPGSPYTGTIWTEIDVKPDAWYLDPAGRMSVGLLLESHQAVLILLSWLGDDQLAGSGRRWRLLGSELTFHGSLPMAGETVCSELRVTGHLEAGGVRLTEVEFDCQAAGARRLSGIAQLGLVTEHQLARATGVRWDPAAFVGGTADPLPVPRTRNRFPAAAVRAVADGRPADCFGRDWEITRAHVRTPRIGAERMRLLGEVSAFDPAGGPAGCGYLRVDTPIGVDDWFFAAHPQNDLCMPANVMVDGCLQAMAFYLIAGGFTLDRDGWRFEPMPDRPCRVTARAQVTPEHRMLTYEVFVRELSAGAEPSLVADVSCSVDGVRALHAAGLGLRLVRDWPLEHWRQLGPPAIQPAGTPVPLSRLGGLRGLTRDDRAADMEGTLGDYVAMLTGAWGDPAVFVPPRFQSRILARHRQHLPGPPYLFITRIHGLGGPPGEPAAGSWLEAEYDVPERVWFFDLNGSAVLPFAALMEILLQPCGVLSACAGSTLDTTTDLFFRNLDGDGVVTAQVRPGTRRLSTRVELRSFLRVGETIIETFGIACHADGDPVFTGSATFGYFPKWAFAMQPGIPPTEAELARFDEPNEFLVDLSRRPARYCGGPLRLAGPMLLMLDRVTGFWPDGGTAGLGRLRAEIDVHADAWYFKAHFYEDPVQPGSLGNEAVCQLLQFYLIETGAAAGLTHPVFEPVMLGAPVTWKYRGQVVPTDKLVTVEAEILAAGEDEHGRYVRARAWLWVDGRRIYHIDDIGMRVAPGDPVYSSAAEVDLVLDPAEHDWVGDHRPMWLEPMLPTLCAADLIAGAAADYLGADVVEVRDLRQRRWLPVPRPVRLRTRVEPAGDDLTVTLLAPGPAGGEFEPAVTATIPLASPLRRPAPFEPLTGLVRQTLPYDSAEMFHGPAFQYLTSWWLGSTGGRGVIDIGRGRVPPGHLSPGVLDAMTHVIPHERMAVWADLVVPDRVGVPSRITNLRVFEPVPADGELLVEARFAGFDDPMRLFPVCDLQLCRDGRVLVTMRLVTALVPIALWATLTPTRRRAFLRDREYADGFGLTTTHDGVTVAVAADVAALDWLPGALAALYRLPPDITAADRLARIAVADHVARAERIHPTQIEITDALHSAQPHGRPDRRHRLELTRAPGEVVVRSAR